MSRSFLKADCLWKVFVIFCRSWAILTTLGLYAVGVEAVYYHHYLGMYLLVVAVTMSFLESVFLLHYFVVACTDETSSNCLRIWDAVLWLDDWKKGLLYLILASICFVNPKEVWMAMITGGMLIISGLLYCMKTISTKRDYKQRSSSRKPAYNRFDEVPEEEIEDSIVNPTGTATFLTSVGDQAEILTV